MCIVTIICVNTYFVHIYIYIIYTYMNVNTYFLFIYILYIHVYITIYSRWIWYGYQQPCWNCPLAISTPSRSKLWGGSSSSWRHPSSVGHGLRYSMWFCVLNLGGVTNNSFMLGIVRVLSLDIVTILTYVYTIIIYIYIYVYILHRWVIFRMMKVLRTEATTWEMSCSPWGRRWLSMHWTFRLGAVWHVPSGKR